MAKPTETPKPPDAPKTRLVVITLPESLIADYCAARAKVARAALPSNVWTNDQASVDLRSATFALAEAAAQADR